MPSGHIQDTYCKSLARTTDRVRAGADSRHGTRDSGSQAQDRDPFAHSHNPPSPGSLPHQPINPLTHYPIIPSPHYPIKNALRPWGLQPFRARMRMRAILLSTMFRLFPRSSLFILRLCRSCGALKSSHPFNPPAHAGGYRYAAPMGLDGLGKPGARQSVIWTFPLLQKPHHEKNGL